MLVIGYSERSKSLRRIYFICILFAGLGIEQTFAQWKLEPALDSLVAQGIDCIWKQEYLQADSIFSEVVYRYPNHPAGYLYRATVIQAHSIDYDVLIESGKFDSLLAQGRTTAASLSSPWCEYFLGTANGCAAYAQVERGEWFGGVKKGMTSASEFEEVLEKDSSFYDAYVGLGTYYYWSSRKTAFIRWLPFVQDNRALGIQLLSIGAEHSEYNRFAAVSALVSIYLDAEEYEQAELWARNGLKSYPENRVFLWGLATAFDRQQHYPEAVTAYTNLLENILHVHLSHPYSEIVCRLNLAKSKLALSDTTTAREHLRKILSYGHSTFPLNIRDRAQRKFEETQQLLTAIEQKHAAIE
jgi:tetratricopeptide (TPR) repeat protein